MKLQLKKLIFNMLYLSLSCDINLKQTTQYQTLYQNRQEFKIIRLYST